LPQRQSRTLGSDGTLLSELRRGRQQEHPRKRVRPGETCEKAPCAKYLLRGLRPRTRPGKTGPMSSGSGPSNAMVSPFVDLGSKGACPNLHACTSAWPARCFPRELTEALRRTRVARNFVSTLCPDSRRLAVLLRATQERLATGWSCQPSCVKLPAKGLSFWGA
jgi:hypothetical protein